MALCEVDPLSPRLLQRVAGLGVDRALLRAEPGTFTSLLLRAHKDLRWTGQNCARSR